VLWAVLEWYKLDIPRLPYFCTLSLARHTWPGLESYSLSALGKHFNIVYNAHNALADAETCGKMALMAAEQFGCTGVAETLNAAGMEMNVLG